MEKKIIAGFILCFFFGTFMSNTSAQEYKYDINNYYTPDIVRNSLDVNFYLNDNISNRKTPFDSSEISTFNWDMNPSFVRYRNTRNQITTFSIGGATNGSLQNNNKINNGDFGKSTNTQNNLSINYSSYFYNPRHIYLMLKASGNYNGSFIKRINYANTLETNTLENQNTYYLKSYIGVGKGRIESVTDARQAVYILEELSKKGKITRTLNGNEIFKFAQTISKVKNKRFLDARLRRIEEITTVDSFLVTNEYLTNQDAAYFTTLYDFWGYGALYDRSSGQRFEINLSPNVFLGNSLYKQATQNTGNRRNDLEYKVEMNLIYKYEKVIDLNWQHSFTSGLNFHMSDLLYETIDDLGFLVKTKMATIGGTFNANYSLSYYPSTRSKFTLFANQVNTIDVNDYITINDIEQPKNQTSNMLSTIGVSADYYFSPQLRLSGSAGIGYNYDSYSSNNTENKYLSGGIGASISYSFF